MNKDEQKYIDGLARGYVEEFGKDFDEETFKKWLKELMEDTPEDELDKIDEDEFKENLPKLMKLIKDKVSSVKESINESAAVNAAVTVASTVWSVYAGSRTRDCMAGLKKKIEEEKDPKKKEKMQNDYDKMIAVNFKPNGSYRIFPSVRRLPKSQRDGYHEMERRIFWDKELKNKGREVRRTETVSFSEDAKACNKKFQDMKDYEKAENEKGVTKDADGNVLKRETVRDPETGKKVKVTTHTGPRGGKFYYPDGKPKKPENKVYVKESLSEYLMRQL